MTDQNAHIERLILSGLTINQMFADLRARGICGRDAQNIVNQVARGRAVTHQMASRVQ